MPMSMAPPLPNEPEPGSVMYRAVTKRVLEEIVDTADAEEFYDARAEESEEAGEGGEGGGAGAGADAGAGQG